MFQNKKISLILPAYNEESGIFHSINEFSRVNFIDEIIVVDNNSTDNTASLIKKTNAKYIFEKIQGYGSAIRRGLKESSGDLLIISEPDGSFEASDLERMIQYTKEYDCVFGTRTSKNYIKKGAKMYFLLRIGNIFVAKMLSFLFPPYVFSDVGCTYKIISRQSYNKFRNKLEVIGSELSPELMIWPIIYKEKIIEIPIIYKARRGESKITKDFLSTAILALKMILLIIKLRIKSFFISNI